MKKFAAIFLLTAYLFSTTELHQLLRLPVVFEHFAAHQQKNKNISFLQFLDIHYMHGSPKDKDYSEDMKLPFKTADNCASMVSPVVIPPVAHLLENHIVHIPEKELYIPKDELIPSSYLSRVWQPPKSC
ncbi:hypothetical protein [Mucilaginibacter psychrotolerans]|uniref:Uncharacterized protein n=1 Tax=Mucilaginibacter psychrotolerans TaxID=1524096 RepID=A0A4Y8SQL5_9SPHI|nr:hypothetical protein [Mucilaginibacter psychrotolerans]TFF40686.1 hypothetical protein E2R66_00440 [Mucilaginibacter psychrotolerans]